MAGGGDSSVGGAGVGYMLSPVFSLPVAYALEDFSDSYAATDYSSNKLDRAQLLFPATFRCFVFCTRGLCLQQGTVFPLEKAEV